MKIKDYDANVYDIEIFPNCFHCTVYDTESKEYHANLCWIHNIDTFRQILSENN